MKFDIDSTSNRGRFRRDSIRRRIEKSLEFQLNNRKFTNKLWFPIKNLSEYVYWQLRLTSKTPRKVAWYRASSYYRAHRARIELESRIPFYLGFYQTLKKNKKEITEGDFSLYFGQSAVPIFFCHKLVGNRKNNEKKSTHRTEKKEKKSAIN